MSHDNLFGAPLPAARRMDPSTSHAAAESIGLDQLRTNQQAVLKTLAAIDGGCDAEIYAALRRRGITMSPSGARTRRNELVAMGLVRDSGDQVRLPSGRWAVVWEVVR